MFDDYPDILTISQVAQLLAVSNNTIYKLVHSGELKHRRIRRAIRIRKSDLLDYMAGP